MRSGLRNLRIELLLIVLPSAMTVLVHVGHAAFLDSVSLLTWAEAYVLLVALQLGYLAGAAADMAVTNRGLSLTRTPRDGAAQQKGRLRPP
jgi:hypothetical protein